MDKKEKISAIMDLAFKYGETKTYKPINKYFQVVLRL